VNSGSVRYSKIGYVRACFPSPTQEREDVASGTNARYRSLLVREEGAGPLR